MPLSNDEKELLRMAICDGAFSDGQPGQPNQLTPEKLAEINAMSDADVRAVLAACKAL